MTDLIFILVEPAVPENIGAAARAIKTMGFRSLRLVRPQVYPHEKMYHVAHASHDILEEAVLFPTLADALADIGFAIATSAKRRSVRFDYHHAAQLPDIIRAKGSTVGKVALVFGREESGLSNEEIEQCNIISFIPMQQKYPSLNLSQAVMLYAYLLSDKNLVRKRKTKKGEEGKFRMMMQMAESILINSRMRPDSAIYHRIFERLSLLSDGDINLVLSFLDKLNRK